MNVADTGSGQILSPLKRNLEASVVLLGAQVLSDHTCAMVLRTCRQSVETHTLPDEAAAESTSMFGDLLRHLWDPLSLPCVNETTRYDDSVKRMGFAVLNASQPITRHRRERFYFLPNSAEPHEEVIE